MERHGETWRDMVRQEETWRGMERHVEACRGMKPEDAVSGKDGDNGKDSDWYLKRSLKSVVRGQQDDSKYFLIDLSTSLYAHIHRSHQ